MNIANLRIEMWKKNNDVNTILNLSGLELTELPKLPDNLEKLDCRYNKLSSLSNLPSLKWLDCRSNKLTDLSTLPTTLTTLYCNGNPLPKSLILPSNIQYTDYGKYSYNIFNNKKYNCKGENLTELPILNDDIEYLDCSDNQITELPLRLPSNLKYLYCQNNKLTRLPELPKSIICVNCCGNKIENYPEKGSIKEFYCDEDFKIFDLIKEEQEKVEQKEYKITEFEDEDNYNSLEDEENNSKTKLFSLSSIYGKDTFNEDLKESDELQFTYDQFIQSLEEIRSEIVKYSDNNQYIIDKIIPFFTKEKMESIISYYQHIINKSKLTYNKILSMFKYNYNEEQHIRKYLEKKDVQTIILNIIQKNVNIKENKNEDEDNYRTEKLNQFEDEDNYNTLDEVISEAKTIVDELEITDRIYVFSSMNDGNVKDIIEKFKIDFKDKLPTTSNKIVVEEENSITYDQFLKLLEPIRNAINEYSDNNEFVIDNISSFFTNNNIERYKRYFTYWKNLTYHRIVVCIERCGISHLVKYLHKTDVKNIIEKIITDYINKKKTKPDNNIPYEQPFNNVETEYVKDSIKISEPDEKLHSIPKSTNMDEISSLLREALKNKKEGQSFVFVYIK